MSPKNDSVFLPLAYVSTGDKENYFLINECSILLSKYILEYWPSSDDYEDSVFFPSVFPLYSLPTS